ncbi:MAG: pitrilysin family protein [Candidatus Delongbacteria bacterium]|jgi:zinc protease|nr:pitrilysin family protein [Candidatus Delongbacteria bacterium]
MISFRSLLLDNGLRLIIHQDKSTPLVCVNLLYKTGAKHENPQRPGMAHLFEHLMFSGSANAPSFDRILETACGENNAFTNNDFTNYYEILPADNLETALFLEADRMQHLNLDQKNIDIQKSVVIEEFKESYLNQPYGDIDAIMRDMAFKKHPYKWSTIGKKIEYIESISHKALHEFYKTHYSPGNAILVITGNIDIDHCCRLVDKYFGSIPSAPLPHINIPTEPEQLNMRQELKMADVPQDAILMGFHMPGRLSPDYYASDLVSDILANGRSSRFYSKLVREKKLFSELDAYIWGSIDPGLLIIQGFPASNISLDDAEHHIWHILNDLKQNPPSYKELTKVKNKALSAWMFSNISIENKALHLAYFEMLGDAGMINKEDAAIANVSKDMFHKTSKYILSKNNCSLLKYKANYEK